MSAYIKTIFVAGSAPGISAPELNKIGQGIEDNAIHTENNIAHNVDSDDVQLTYLSGKLMVVKEYIGIVLVKQTDLTYTGEDLTGVRERFYRDGVVVDDYTSVLAYTSGALSSVERSGV